MMDKWREMRSDRLVNGGNLAIVILVLLVLGCSCQKFADLVNKADEPPPASGSTPSQKNTATGQYDVTRAKYDKIKTGMSSSDVEDLLGGRGREVTTTKGGGKTFRVQAWDGEDFKTIIVTFQNDKVLTKTEAGLDSD
jgi:hypothetical protein